MSTCYFNLEYRRSDFIWTTTLKSSGLTFHLFTWKTMRCSKIMHDCSLCAYHMWFTSVYKKVSNPIMLFKYEFPCDCFIILFFFCLFFIRFEALNLKLTTIQVIVPEKIWKHSQYCSISSYLIGILWKNILDT